MIDSPPPRVQPQAPLVTVEDLDSATVTRHCAAIERIVGSDCSVRLESMSSSAVPSPDHVFEIPAVRSDRSGHVDHVVVSGMSDAQAAAVADQIDYVVNCIAADLRVIDGEREIGQYRSAAAHKDDFVTLLRKVATSATKSDGIAATVDALVEQGAAAVGASIATLAILDGDQVRFSHGSSVDAQTQAEWPSAPLSADVPLAAAVRSRAPIVIPDRTGFGDWSIDEEISRLGLHAYVALPLVDRAYDLVAAIGVGFTSPLATNDVPGPVIRLGNLTLDALRNAHRFESERQQALTLEDIVLPQRLRSDDQFSVGAAYLYPNFDQRIGGDVFDTFHYADGRFGVMIADAAGHNLLATRAATQVRHSVAAAAHLGCGPAEILSAVNRYLLNAAETHYATCALAIFEPDSDLVTVASAGHPSPRLVGGEAVAEIGPLGEPLLGVTEFDYTEQVLRVEEGQTVLLFTDGVIERRSRPFGDGEAWLGSFLRNVGSDPVEVARTLLVECSTHDRDDDVAVIAIARDRAGRAVRFTRSSVFADIRSESVVLGGARSWVRSWLEVCGLDHMADPSTLVATELLTNARNGAPDERTEIGLSLEADVVSISVSNPALPFPITDQMPTSPDPGGRGLPIVYELAHSVKVSHESGRATVTAWLPVGTV